MADTDDVVVTSWRHRVGSLCKRGRIGAVALMVVPAEEVDVRRGRPPASERLSEAERALWDKVRSAGGRAGSRVRNRFWKAF